MEYIIIIVSILILLICLAIIYEFNLKKLKKIAKEEEEKLNNIIDKYPSNVEICKYILNKINNNNVKIEENKNYESCLYIAITNKIILADVKGSYTRIQTIAHECLHSIQNRKMLLFNFIFSNLYLLYFVTIIILNVLNVLPYKMVFLSLMIILGFTYYFIRSYLEMDAMIKAKFLAKEYLEEIGISSKEEINAIVSSYDLINNLGIKMTSYSLFLETFIKTLIMAVVFFLK